jgi:hypothetical protein
MRTAGSICGPTQLTISDSRKLVISASGVLNCSSGKLLDGLFVYLVCNGFASIHEQ